MVLFYWRYPVPEIPDFPNLFQEFIRIVRNYHDKNIQATTEFEKELKDFNQNLAEVLKENE